MIPQHEGKVKIQYCDDCIVYISKGNTLYQLTGNGFKTMREFSNDIYSPIFKNERLGFLLCNGDEEETDHFVQNVDSIVQVDPETFKIFNKGIEYDGLCHMNDLFLGWRGHCLFLHEDIKLIDRRPLFQRLKEDVFQDIKFMVTLISESLFAITFSNFEDHLKIEFIVSEQMVSLGRYLNLNEKTKLYFENYCNNMTMELSSFEKLRNLLLSFNDFQDNLRYFHVVVPRKGSTARFRGTENVICCFATTRVNSLQREDSISKPLIRLFKTLGKNSGKILIDILSNFVLIYAKRPTIFVLKSTLRNIMNLYMKQLNQLGHFSRMADVSVLLNGILKEELTMAQKLFPKSIHEKFNLAITEDPNSRFHNPSKAFICIFCEKRIKSEIVWCRFCGSVLHSHHYIAHNNSHTK
ncbi:hypothetical protein ROZALSC1DRAFT_30599 [Rozella allomycis CSF55]|uniref:Uncharacterized protein n=1 Tax=Rozella allomycis (strain CSF55) TaxID=988480 RepID=A0A4P9YEI8_ROZAC|nr:hypothetical protein ROZALSC1DRAFT_30599 [Rozella allomycis CSF55]